MIDATFAPLSKNKLPQNPLKHPSLSLFIGPTRSGKTTAMLNFLGALAEEVNFDRILFVSANKKDDLLDLLDDDVEVTSNPLRMEEWMLNVMKDTNPKLQNKLLILDDLQGSKKFDLMSPRSEFSELVINHRHFNTWIVGACQTFRKCFGPDVRKQASMYFLFPPRGATEMEAIEKEIDAPLQQIRTAMKVVKGREGKNFLYVNMFDRHPKFYVNFDELIDF